MSMTANKILEQLNLEDGGAKIRTSINVSEDVWRDFQSACGAHSASKVLEKLMIWFIDSKAKKSA